MPILKTHRQALLALFLFGLTLGLYVNALPSSITWANSGADSGDLATAVARLGIPHPPGYPTYILFGRFFQILPFGDTAYRLNLLSATAGAGAVALLFLAAEALLQRKREDPWLHRLPALLAALALAFSPIFHGQSLVAEVYSLAALFAAALLLLLLSMWRDPAGLAWKLPLFAFLLGLGMGIHYTLLLLALPIAIAVLWRRRATPKRLWFASLGLFVLALGVFLYLPLAARGNPPVNWGDPKTWDGFWFDVSAAPYHGYLFSIPTELVPSRLGDWAKSMVDQLQGVGILLAAVGCWRLWRLDRLLALALAVAFLALSAYATFYYTGDSFVFLIPAVMLGCLALAIGTRYVLAWIAQAKHPQAARFAALFAVALLLLVPGVGFARNRATMDLSHDHEARDYGRKVLASAEPNGIILADTDRPLFALWYQRYVVDRGPGPRVIARNLLQYQWYRDSEERRTPGMMPTLTEELPFQAVLEAFVKLHLDKQPLYTVSDDPYLRYSYELAPKGLLFEVRPLPPRQLTAP